MTDKSNTQAADWLHLKPYGYAPGNYMSKCFGCKRVLPNLDKMASRCRPCAEALAAQPTPEPSFAGIAARKLDDLKAQGYAVDGYSIQHAETKQRGFITTGGFVGWWINTDHVQPGTEPVAQADEMDKLTLTITFDDDVDCSIEVFGTTKHLTRLKTWLERCDLANEAIAARASLPAGGVVEPVAWRGRNSLGEVVTDWLEYQHQTAEGVKKLFADEGGTVEYAYAAPRPSETQGRRQMTDEMLKVLKGCRDTAMAKAASARVPECGDFGGIAQDLDWLVTELCPASPQDGGEKA